MSTANITNYDFRTPKERERDQRNERICNKYIGLKAAYPQMKPARIATLIGDAEHLAPNTILNILRVKHLI